MHVDLISMDTKKTNAGLADKKTGPINQFSSDAIRRSPQDN